MPGITIQDQILCVQREIDMRRRVYPGWVQNGKMKAEKADAEVERMEAVLRTLKWVAKQEDQQMELF